MGAMKLTGFLVCLFVLVSTASAQPPPQNVMCFRRSDCTGGGGVASTREACCSNRMDPVGGFFRVEGSQTCQRCPIVFGFTTTEFIGVEQGQDYYILAGYLSGRPNTRGIFRLESQLGNASAADVSLTTSTIRILPNTPLVPVNFTLRDDSVAQEFRETFSIRFRNIPLLNTGLFPTPPIVVHDTVNVTIVDGDSVEFGLSEEDFRGFEVNDVLTVVVSKNAKFLANPVTLRVTPLTIGQAKARGFDLSLPPDNMMSPIEADEADFNTASLEVLFPDDEGINRPITRREASITISNDGIDEAENQYFAVFLEVISALRHTRIQLGRRVSTCVIVDNHNTRIGFSQDMYTFAEPSSERLVRNVTLVREGGRRSEQTFTVVVTVSNPVFTERAATLKTSPDPRDDYDYRLPSPGNSVSLTFPPFAESITFAFFLNSDELVEGLEAFRATVRPGEQGPPFQPPQSETVFSSTEIRILDDDRGVIATTPSKGTIATTSPGGVTTTSGSSTAATTTPPVTTPSKSTAAPTTPPGEVTTPSKSTAATTTPSVPTDPTSGLYFELNGQRYQPGSEILIADIGTSSASSITNAGSSLACVTSEVNTQCCRKRDGGNVGEWHFPDGTVVPRNRDSRGGDFARTGFTHHVRLNRRNNAMGPVGTYTCRVPDPDDSSVVHSATIKLVARVLPTPRQVLCFCSVCVWQAPEGPLDIHAGYDIRFSGTVVISKSKDEFFHVMAGDARILALGPQEEVTVEVRVRSEGGEVNPWSDPVALCTNPEA